jgi:hypothetical protein
LTALKEKAPTAEAVALVESWEKSGVPIRVVFEDPMTFENAHRLGRPCALYMAWTWAAVNALLNMRRSSMEHKAPFRKPEADPRVKLVNA